MRGLLKSNSLKAGGSHVSDQSLLSTGLALRLPAALGTVGLVLTPSLLRPQVKGMCGHLVYAQHLLSDML